jgi:hypothetical protein
MQNAAGWISRTPRDFSDDAHADADGCAPAVYAGENAHEPDWSLPGNRG